MFLRRRYFAYFLTTNNQGIILNKADIQADMIISLTELTGE